MAVSPLSLRERVGVRGYGPSFVRNPSPDLLRKSTSPDGRGERSAGYAPLQNLSIIFQYLKHAAGHGDTALFGGHLGGDENQAAGRAHHARLRQQDLADLSAVDE